MLKVYAYAGCDTCRKALKYLKERDVTHKVLPIRETPPSKAELKRMLASYSGDLRKLFNTSGQDYRALGLGAKLASMTESAALDLLASNGNLVKRPFVVSGKSGWVGFKVEEWDRLIG